MTETLRADEDGVVERVTALLDEGRLAVLPTDTQYALSADALNEDAVLDVFRVKRRAPDMPLPVCVGGFDEVGHVAHATPLARRFADKWWPGPVTLVLKAKPWVPEAVTAGGGTVAVRVPAHPFALALARRFGPYTVTSANRHGEPPAADVASARAALAGDVAVYVDGGALLGKASTIVDCTGADARVLREGAVLASEVLALGREGDRELQAGR